ncbi:hypothetical protein JNO12_23015 [Erwinia aphidicola]|nr:hypothetical protein [Erwinia aphidicola]
MRAGISGWVLIHSGRLNPPLTFSPRLRQLLINLHHRRQRASLRLHLCHRVLVRFALHTARELQLVNKGGGLQQRIADAADVPG